MRMQLNSNFVSFRDFLSLSILITEAPLIAA